jgi:hypothetical protein
VIEFVCRECGGVREVPSDAAGRQVRCQECGARGVAWPEPSGPNPLLWILGGFGIAAFVVAGLVGVVVLKVTLHPPRQVSTPPAITRQETPLPAEPSGTPKEPGWTDASRRSVTLGEVQVGISKVALGHVPLRDFRGPGISQERSLMVHVWVRNLSATRKVDFETWNQGLRPHGAVLNDNFGNSYKRVVFGFGTEVVGSKEAASIHPGKHETAILVFEPPLSNAERLRLELEPTAFGGRGDPVRFEIPAGMVQK